MTGVSSRLITINTNIADFNTIPINTGKNLSLAGLKLTRIDHFLLLP